jgi:hypothetical protein
VPRNLIVVEPDEHLTRRAKSRPKASAKPKGPPLRERARKALRDLDARHPRLSRWVGGRLDIEVPALLVSLAVHLAVLAVLGMVGYAVRHEVGGHFEAALVDTALGDLERSNFQDIDQTAEPPALAPTAGSFAPNLAAITIQPSASGRPGAVSPDLATRAAARIEMAKLDVQRAAESVVPTASLYGQTVSIKGNGAEHADNAEGAVDRLAEEILRHVEKDRTLVVWAFDASGSLQPERERLAKHIETVYTHISQFDRENKAEDGGLLTTVVAFGQGRKAMTEGPTDDPDTIASAIRSVPLDPTGIETTFQTVAEISQKWGRYKDKRGRPYQAMIIVVTDEVGDDEMFLDRAIETANRAKTPVYVLGSQAIFGRSEGRVNFTDPKTGRTFYNVPIRQGPESVMLEQVRLPFWYGGDQYDQLESGFGPYALSRLAGATGGIYFVTRLGERRMGFDPAVMREYRPDWVSRARYETEVTSKPVRKAVIEAAMLTQQNLPGMPSLVFPPVDGTEFKEAMERNQAIAARTGYTVEAALEPINAVAKLRDRETSRRWQAHFDLVRGRLLAMRVRCDEYNFACADMKRNPRKFNRPEANSWRLVPDREIRFSAQAVAAAEQAAKLLRRVVDEHPNTPWALLAERELKDPFGFKWVETRVQPIVRDNNDDDSPARKQARANQPKPQEPPKL